jgi:hypothetical protein
MKASECLYTYKDYSKLQLIQPNLNDLNLSLVYDNPWH